MKFAIVSLNNILKINKILNRLDLKIDNDNPDFVITYGGDGTILYAERKFPNIPKVTVRGSEGGLRCLYTESELENVLLKIKDNKYQLKDELKLETEFEGKKYFSLNEVQIHNSSPIKAVRFSVCIDNSLVFNNIVGDGVIIATPFGSTAYYMSVGGERFNKGIGVAFNNQYKVKYAKYRPVIISEDSKIHIKILRDDGLLVFDNNEIMIKVKGGDNIIIKAAKDVAKFVII